jgi:hypothetical protein
MSTERWPEMFMRSYLECPLLTGVFPDRPMTTVIKANFKKPLRELTCYIKYYTEIDPAIKRLAKQVMSDYFEEGSIDSICESYAARFSYVTKERQKTDATKGE